jgi:hydrophobe/amphiphile efflux-1 (HAE1) family protein
MYLLGYSINLLTLFGMVLAVGIVVDDAIVVVENVERNMRELQLSAKEAALKAMDEVTAPIIAIVCVLCAVFIPVAFLGGIAGQLYRQFAITIAISVCISGLVALTLSPAIAAILLKHEQPFKWAIKFDGWFGKITNGYLLLTRKLLARKILGLAVFALLLVAISYLFIRTPTSFVPDEDQGYLIVVSNLPDAASLERTVQVDQKVEEIAMRHPGVKHVVSFTGFSLIESLDRTTIGTNFIVLKDWKERKKKTLHADQILQDLNKEFYDSIQDAAVTAFNPPSIQGLGTVGGFEFWLENRGDGGAPALEQALNDFIHRAKEYPALKPLTTTAQFNNLQFFVDLDRYKCRMLGVSISDVFQALQTLVGSVYVNNFNKFGRVYQVIVQAEPSHREKLSNLGDMYVRSSMGEMVPLKSVISIRPAAGANLVSRFNDYPAAEILGGPRRGYTSGQAIEAMVELAKGLPPEISYGWSGAAFQQIATGGTSLGIFVAALLMVFLILAALYEKWSAPVVILMAVPFGIFGALCAIAIRGMPNDVYFQIGLVTLIALSAKNAILIVEFAIMKHKEGLDLIEATIAAARLRFRAIIMTSLTFIFGVIPLVISTGAGAASRHSVGVGVLGGMISATTLALLFVPLFFLLLYRAKR